MKLSTFPLILALVLFLSANTCRGMQKQPGDWKWVCAGCNDRSARPTKATEGLQDIIETCGAPGKLDPNQICLSDRKKRGVQCSKDDCGVISLVNRRGAGPGCNCAYSRVYDGPTTSVNSGLSLGRST
ncbi:hypothetical protein PtA15_10A604 [Puccinia triticina]|uniref:Cyanovirin-N domain-containing protein n=1 Tax=Puccinia triticina TaxID=208348 RepID=A0ABY7CZG6_9BASI|nr:uncharacterized protein PtA15_10A604 [Puccinia triticina]WAQ89180.1 hypothetical protein PtA15_10A604 [Puccinia triticina]